MVSIRKDSFNIQGLNLTPASGTKFVGVAEHVGKGLNEPLLHFNEMGKDLLTQSAQNVYGAQSVQASYNKTIADASNATLKDLGCNFRVTPSQVASVAKGLKEDVIPGIELAARGAVEANIQDPNGLFAELFT